MGKICFNMTLTVFLLGVLRDWLLRMSWLNGNIVILTKFSSATAREGVTTMSLLWRYFQQFCSVCLFALGSLTQLKWRFFSGGGIKVHKGHDEQMFLIFVFHYLTCPHELVILSGKLITCLDNINSCLDDFLTGAEKFISNLSEHASNNEQQINLTGYLDESSGYPVQLMCCSLVHPLAMEWESHDFAVITSYVVGPPLLSSHVTFNMGRERRCPQWKKTWYIGIEQLRSVTPGDVYRSIRQVYISVSGTSRSPHGHIWSDRPTRRVYVCRRTKNASNGHIFTPGFLRIFAIGKYFKSAFKVRVV